MENWSCRFWSNFLKIGFTAQRVLVLVFNRFDTRYDPLSTRSVSFGGHFHKTSLPSGRYCELDLLSNSDEKEKHKHHVYFIDEFPEVEKCGGGGDRCVPGRQPGLGHHGGQPREGNKKQEQGRRRWYFWISFVVPIYTYII